MNISNSTDTNRREKEILDTINWNKLLFLFKKNIKWIIVIFILVGLISYLKVRLTFPLYMSRIEIKMEKEYSSAGLLGGNFTSLEESIERTDNLLSQVAIISSDVMLDSIITLEGLSITYYQQNGIIKSELFGKSPFRVKYKIFNYYVYNKKFNIKILNKDEFILSYQFSDENYSAAHRFGETISSIDFEISVNTTININDTILGNYYFTINDKEYLKRHIKSNLRIYIVDRGVGIIQISYKDYDRIKALKILEKIVNCYEQMTIENTNRKYEQSLKYLEYQLQTITDTSRFLAGNIRSLPKVVHYANNIGYSNIFNNILEIEKEIEGLLSELDIYYKMQDSLNTNSGISFIHSMSIIINNNGLTDLTEKLIETELNAERVEGYYKKNTYSRKQILSLKENIKDLVNKLLTLIIEKLNEEIENKKKELENFNLLVEASRDPNFESLNYLMERYRNHSELLTNKIIEINIAKSSTSRNFQILSPSYASSIPISPVPLLIYSVSFLLAFVISISMIVIKYLLKNEIGSLQEIESLSMISVLGIIPEYDDKDMKFSKLLVTKTYRSTIIESMRSIRTNIDFIAKEKKRIISVTSIISKEGKTFVALNLAGIIALSQTKKVIVVDLDLRKPKIHKGFASKNERGISNILVSKNQIKECIQKTEIENLDFISAGVMPPNPSGLISSSIFDDLIRKLKEEYDTIIFDTPPVGLVTDGIIIMKKANIQLFVLRVGFSKLSFVKKVDKIKNIYKLTNPAFLLNGLSHKNSYDHSNLHGYYGYSYYHGNYYGNYYTNNSSKKLSKEKR